jgi:hypothetical protein
MAATTNTIDRTPTLSQMRAKYETDLQVVGLQILSDAAASSRPADYIGGCLDAIRDSYDARSATYIIEFVMGHAERRGLLGV